MVLELNKHKLSLYTVVWGLNLRYLLGPVLHYNTIILDLFIYAVLITNIDWQKNIKYIPCLAVLSILIIFNTEAMRLCLIVLLCFWGLDVKIEDVAKQNVFTGIVFILIVFYLLHTGILRDESYVAISEAQERVRHSLGLGYNRFSIYVISIIINLYIYLKDKNPYFVLVLILTISLWCYWETASNTAFVAALILIVVHIVRFTFLSGFFFQRKILCLIPIVIISLFIFLSVYYKSFPIIDSALTGRLRFSSIFLNDVNWQDFLFGNADKMSSSSYYVDSSYLHLIFEGGVIFLLFFMVIYMKTMSKVERADYYILPAVFAAMVSGLTECTLVEVSMVGNITFWIILYRYSNRPIISKK